MTGVKYGVLGNLQSLGMAFRDSDLPLVRAVCGVWCRCVKLVYSVEPELCVEEEENMPIAKSRHTVIKTGHECLGVNDVEFQGFQAESLATCDATSIYAHTYIHTVRRKGFEKKNEVVCQGCCPFLTSGSQCDCAVGYSTLYLFL